MRRNCGLPECFRFNSLHYHVGTGSNHLLRSSSSDVNSYVSYFSQGSDSASCLVGGNKCRSRANAAVHAATESATGRSNAAARSDIRFPEQSETQNPPQAPPGTTPTNPTTPPGTTPGQTQPPVTRRQPATVPGGEVSARSASRIFRSSKRGRCRRFPSHQRLGVGTETIPLTLNDAIKRALENNNDIEVARDDVRFAETQLRVARRNLRSRYSTITPQYDKRISTAVQS